MTNLDFQILKKKDFVYLHHIKLIHGISENT